MLERPTQFSPEISSKEYTHSLRDMRPIIKKFFLGMVVSIFLLVATGYFLFLSLNKAPSAFPVDIPIIIEAGTTAREIANILEQEGVVRSEVVLYYTLLVLYDPAKIKASTYIFTEPLTTVAVARRLSEGDFATNLIRFTHIEGERVSKIAERAKLVHPKFKQERFLIAAEPYEGKLFPETYFIPETFSDEALLALMLQTFDTKTATLQAQVAASSLSLDEIIVLASIVEREANNLESKRLVASVLLNRIEIGMALQADASIEYILDKPLAALTPDDLKIDSPYNTYLYTGLPPTPIGNPGLEAIMAVLEPAESDYFYYITDNDGVFHFAETYNQHLNNIERYLR